MIRVNSWDQHFLSLNNSCAFSYTLVSALVSWFELWITSVSFKSGFEFQFQFSPETCLRGMPSFSAAKPVTVTSSKCISGTVPALSGIDARQRSFDMYVGRMTVPPKKWMFIPYCNVHCGNGSMGYYGLCVWGSSCMVRKSTQDVFGANYTIILIILLYGQFFKFYQKRVILIYQNICCFQNFVLIHVIHNEWKQTYPRWEILSYFLNLKTRSLYDVWVKKYKRNAKGQKNE